MQIKHTGRTLPGLKVKPKDEVLKATRVRDEAYQAVDMIRARLLETLVRSPPFEPDATINWH